MTEEKQTIIKDNRHNCRLEAGGTEEVRPVVPPASCRQTEGLRKRYRGRLPHWEIDGGTYFVTFRLDDSIPRNVADSYRFERENIVKTAEQLNRPLTEDELTRLSKLYSTRIEQYLDKGIGSCYLQQPEIAALVRNVFEFFNNQRYQLCAWCIMPNHVHIIFSPSAGYTLDQILHSWKSYTAKEANKYLKHTGTFWQREYYDHLIRNEKEFQRIVHYVIDNPEKAGLDHWPWVKLYVD